MGKPILTKHDQENIGIGVIFVTLLLALGTFLLCTGSFAIGVALGIGILSIIPWGFIMVIMTAFLYSGYHWQ